MKISFFNKHFLALFFACSLMNAFAQDAQDAQSEPEKPAEPGKLAVYVYGAGEASINKSLGNKLLLAIAQSGKYAEISNWEAFYRELAEDAGQIAQTAERYGADFVCTVNILEVFGDYSIFARITKLADSQIIKTVLLDRSIKSLNDLTMVSNELAALLLGLPPPVPAPLLAPPSPVAEEADLPVALSKDKEGDSKDKKGWKMPPLGFRTGFNFSHLYTEYNGLYGEGTGSYASATGFQAGLLVNIALKSWFHIQPGIMYIQKGTEDDNLNLLTRYIELLPASLSFKYSMFRVSAGPYFGICVDAPKYINKDKIDIGINAGLGADIGMYYIGVFYDYGFVDVSKKMNFDFYNRTLGFNLGVNL